MDETKTFQLRDNNFTKIANGEYSNFFFKYLQVS